MTIPTNSRAWQRMLSGRRLDLLEPSPLDVEIGDIAHGLARVARWNGQTRGEHAFSVAQHSLLVERVYAGLCTEPTREGRIYALLHDAPEYVIGDMISPFKAVIGGAYKEVEDRLQTAVHLHVGLPGKMPQRTKKLIKKADGIVAFYEATHLAGFDYSEASKFFIVPEQTFLTKDDLVPQPPVQAQAAFLEKMANLDNAK